MTLILLLLQYYIRLTACFKDNLGKKQRKQFYCHGHQVQPMMTTLCLKKSSHLLALCNSKIFALQESVRNLLQNPDDITHLILGMFLNYLGKLKLQIFCRKQTNCIFNRLYLCYSSTNFNIFGV